jgi:hypothetical protein
LELLNLGDTVTNLITDKNSGDSSQRKRDVRIFIELSSHLSKVVEGTVPELDSSILFILLQFVISV